MDEKINLEAIARYADAYAERVLKGFFSTHDQITGKEILSLCDIHQVNLFVIRELFKAWKEETQRQKSPYFDFEHPEVKDALQNYTRILSNHILIDETHFTPLLKKAVTQTLLVIFNPYDFYSSLISGSNNTLELQVFRDELKYLKINKPPLEKMLQKLEERKIRVIPGNEAFAILDQILEEVNFTPEDVDEYVTRFSSVVKLDPETFYISKTPPPQANRQPQGVKVPVQPQNAVKPVVETTLHDKLNHTTARQAAVIDNLRKIAKIKDSLTINQKFMFTKVLFYGDFESFSRTIDEIDRLPDMNAALRYLEEQCSTWDRESKEFHEFMEMVEKRFS